MAPKIMIALLRTIPMGHGINERRASGGVSIQFDFYDTSHFSFLCSFPDRAYVLDLSEHAKSRPMGLERNGASRGHCMHWMGHQLLYGETVRRSERHYRRCWVSIPVSLW